MHARVVAWVCAGAGVAASGCVPSGNASSSDSGASTQAAAPAVVASQRPLVTTTPAAAPAAQDLLKAPFEDNFDRTSPQLAPADAPASSAAPSTAVTSASPGAVDPGPDWEVTQAGAWRIEGGRLCGEHARNHGLWLKRTLPTNARIEFDAQSTSTDGDLKAEYWGDGRSFATALSYTNATSYLTIFGGWHNKYHVLARINEHGNDRQQIEVDPKSDDPREKPVVAGQFYHFKVERSDGKNVKWWVDGNEMLTYADGAPLVGGGHDHFGFNDWDVKVCFDNLRIVPLP